VSRLENYNNLIPRVSQSIGNLWVYEPPNGAEPLQLQS
jgi:hypothetical protein